MDLRIHEIIPTLLSFNSVKNKSYVYKMIIFTYVTFYILKKPRIYNLPLYAKLTHLRCDNSNFRPIVV
ncbi:hypothetical protein HanPI659440_Chr12g0449851 [Helianthus annuus]|nr:hypothetical protein HanPI659440_Chr12g0449851 [Helianthus annuus]